jgi:hypothetical protein
MSRVKGLALRLDAIDPEWVFRDRPGRPATGLDAGLFRLACRRPPRDAGGLLAGRGRGRCLRPVGRDSVAGGSRWSASSARRERRPSMAPDWAFSHPEIPAGVRRALRAGHPGIDATGTNTRSAPLASSAEHLATGSRSETRSVTASVTEGQRGPSVWLKRCAREDSNLRPTA